MQLSLNEVSLRLEQLQQAERGGVLKGFGLDMAGGRWENTLLHLVGLVSETGKAEKFWWLKKQKNVNESLSCNKSGTSEEHSIET